MTNNIKLAIGLTILPILLFITLVMAATSHDWETLASGFMSVGAAIWAGFLLSKQIQQTETHERERSKRKYLVARSTLPLALTDICDFCKRSTEQLTPVYAYVISPKGRVKPYLEVQELPDNMLEIINAMLEFSPHDAVSDRLSDMLIMIQIFQARLRACRDSDFHRTLSVRDFSVARYIINALEILVTANSLFEYSRKKADYDKPFELEPISYDRVLDMCSSIGLDSEDYEPIHAIVRRYRDEGYVVDASMFDSMF